MTAVLRHDPAEVYRRLEEQYGPTAYARIDAPATVRQKAVLKDLDPGLIRRETLAGTRIIAKQTRAPWNDAPFGGLKVITEAGWFAARPSGTEDVYKIYAESCQGEAHLKQLQEEAQVLINEAFKDSGV
jgi:phosphoglucomutase